MVRDIVIHMIIEAGPTIRQYMRKKKKPISEATVRRALQTPELREMIMQGDSFIRKLEEDPK